MLENALDFIKDYKENIEGQSEYIKTTDWSFLEFREARSEEYKLQNKILTNLLARLKYVIIEAGEDIKTNKTLEKFCKGIAASIDNHIKRCNKYFKTERWKDYEGDNATEDKAAEIEFQDAILKEVIKLREELSKLNLNNDQKNVDIPIHGNSVISIPMAAMVEERYPEIKTFREKKK